MAVSKELKIIKKKYGERFMHLCRELFPTILEKEGVLLDILSSLFATNSNTLGEDIINNNLKEQVKAYIYSKFAIEEKDEVIVDKTPYELLDEAGYDLYECKTEEDIQKFKRYYTRGEKLCTFDGERLYTNIVFFAVKKNVDEIKRENFKNPQREDEYGTSVMSIQFCKWGICTVSIKNRYNHTVENPDATLGNNLDKIIPGLTNSFKTLLREKYKLELDTINEEEFEIPGYTVANDGRYYKYNMEVNAKYYCRGNIVIDGGQVHKIENPERNILMDYFILDVQNKTINAYDDRVQDSFVDEFKDIKKIDILRNENGRVITVKTQADRVIIIEIDKNNQIVSYENEELREVNDGFLKYNICLSNLKLPNLEKAGESFLMNNENVTELELPKLQSAGRYFFEENSIINKLKIPMLRKLGDYSLVNNKELTELELPYLEEIPLYFLQKNKKLNKLIMPNVRIVKNAFLNGNKALKRLEMPKVEIIGNEFLYDNIELDDIYLPKVRKIGDHFLYNNLGLNSISFEELEEVGDNFLHQNERIWKLECPRLITVGKEFLLNNDGLTRLNLPNLKEAEEYFLFRNTKLTHISLPNVNIIGVSSLKHADNILFADLPDNLYYTHIFLERINRNIKRLEVKASNNVKPQRITQLDINNNLSTGEINNAFEGRMRVEETKEEEL